jgi:hypothetical protein
MNKQLTCEERIGEDLASTEEHFKDLFTRADNGEDEAREEIYEQAYGLSKYTLVKIELSGGGPSSWLEIKISSELDVMSVTYYFADWFDVASREILEGSPLYRYALEMIEGIYA